MLNNQKKNVKNKNERSEVDVLSGFSVYHDDKNRTIYYNRLNHRGYVIKPRDFTTFRTFSKRLFAALARHRPHVLFRERLQHDALHPDRRGHPRLCRHAVQVFFLLASVHDGR